jgi:hypothetical protein
MKKYLLGFSAVILAVAFTAFTTPKKSFINYYRFAYQLGTFAKADVETETVAKWGYGTLVTSTSDFTLACNGTNTKACEIIVPEASVIDATGFGDMRMRSLDAGDASNANNVALTAAGSGSIFYVNTGTNLTNKQNKN